MALSPYIKLSAPACSLLTGDCNKERCQVEFRALAQAGGSFTLKISACEFITSGSHIFQLWESKTCLISTLNKCRIMFSQIYLIWGHAFTCLSKLKLKFSKLYFKQNTWEIERRWDHQLTHLHIHIKCSRNVSLKITKIQNFISSLLFIWFTSNFHCSILNVLLFLLN